MPDKRSFYFQHYLLNKQTNPTSLLWLTCFSTYLSLAPDSYLTTMRRFEKRGTEAPMDFEYENKDRDLGPGWSPFRDTFQKRREFNQSTIYLTIVQ